MSKHPPLHNSRALLAKLVNFLGGLTLPIGKYEVSDLKADGTVFIRCMSNHSVSAECAALVLLMGLTSRKLKFAQTDKFKFRLALDQFLNERV